MPLIHLLACAAQQGAPTPPVETTPVEATLALDTGGTGADTAGPLVPEPRETGAEDTSGALPCPDPPAARPSHLDSGAERVIDLSPDSGRAPGSGLAEARRPANPSACLPFARLDADPHRICAPHDALSVAFPERSTEGSWTLMLDGRALQQVEVRPSWLSGGGSRVLREGSWLPHPGRGWSPGASHAGEELPPGAGLRLTELLLFPSAARGAQDADCEGGLDPWRDRFVELTNLGPDGVDLAAYTLLGPAGDPVPLPRRYVPPAGRVVLKPVDTRVCTPPGGLTLRLGHRVQPLQDHAWAGLIQVDGGAALAGLASPPEEDGVGWVQLTLPEIGEATREGAPAVAPLPELAGAFGVALAQDLDLDLQPDALAYASEASWLLLAPGTPQSAVHLLAEGPLAALARPLADLNGDRRPEVALAEAEGFVARFRLGPVTVGPGLGVSVPTWAVVEEDCQQQRAHQATLHTLGDLDGDGLDDLVLHSPQRVNASLLAWSAPLSAWEVRESARARWVEDQPDAVLSRPGLGLRWSDLDGDGRAELVAMGDEVSLVLDGDAEGLVPTSAAFARVQLGTAGDLLALDSDGDGRQVLVGLTQERVFTLAMARPGAYSAEVADFDHPVDPVGASPGRLFSPGPSALLVVTPAGLLRLEGDFE